MNPTLKAAPPLAIAAAGIVLAQVAGVGFWIALAGLWQGWLASLTWEAASVWLWWRGDRGWRGRPLGLRTAKWAATFALMFGMLAETAGPVAELALEEFGREGTGREVLAILKAQAEAGHWTSQTTLKKAMSAAEASPWLPALKALGAAVLFPALYGIALVALATAGREWRENRMENSRENSAADFPANLLDFPGAENGKHAENAVARIRAAVDSMGAGTRKELAAAVRISEGQLSLGYNHESSKSNKRLTLASLENLAERLENHAARMRRNG